ncbi:MAG TPA: type 4a pilus biogenesis protein PilO [Actinomycetales bacterium]|nr:type 4a pilus biogenesis protein PilO [Actinomycetales bacterium]
MTSTRTWTVGAAVLAVLLVIAGWFTLVSPQRSAAADLRDQVAAQQASNDQIALKTKQLQAQFASLPERQAQLAEIKQQMPDNPALPALIRDLSSYAKAAGVSLDSVAPGAPTAVAVAAGANQPVTAPGQAPTSATSTGLLSIPTTITAVGSYSDLTLYLQKLQTSMRRAFLVNTVTLINGTDKPGTLQMTLSGEVFVMNTADASAAPQAPAAPTTTPAS